MIKRMEKKYGLLSGVFVLLSAIMGFYLLGLDRFIYVSAFYGIAIFMILIVEILFLRKDFPGKDWLTSFTVFMSLSFSLVYFHIEFKLVEQVIFFLTIYYGSKSLVWYGIVLLSVKLGIEPVMKKKKSSNY